MQTKTTIIFQRMLSVSQLAVNVIQCTLNVHQHMLNVRLAAEAVESV